MEPPEDSICSSEGSRDPAQTSPTPESGLVWRVIDRAFGLKWRASFAFFSPEWSSSKMSQDSCAPWLADQGSLLSESSSLIWPNSGMTLDGVAYRLPMWELHISEVASSFSPGVELLPTVAAQDAKGGETRESRKLRGAGGPSLQDLPKLLPTPTAEESRGTAERHLERKNIRDGGNRTTVTSLEILVKTLPTPTAADAKGSGSRNQPGSKAKPGMSLTDWVKTGDSSTPRLPTPMANEKNPGTGGELRAALIHGPGRRNETGIDTMGRPNRGRPSRLLPTPTTQDANNNGGPSQQQRNTDPLNVVASLLPSPTSHIAGRGKGSAERYKGDKSQKGRRSNLEDAFEVIKEASTGESSSPPFDAGNSSLDQPQTQLTIEDVSTPDSVNGCSDSRRDG